MILEQWARERPDLDAAPMAVFGRVLRAARYLDAALREGFRPFELDFGLFDVLATLRRNGPPYTMPPRDLNRWCMLTSGAMTKRIDRLADMGLVTRFDDPDDRRGVLVQLSPTGLELINEAVVAHVANERRLLGQLNDEQQAELSDLLRVLLVHLESEVGHPGEQVRASA